MSEGRPRDIAPGTTIVVDKPSTGILRASQRKWVADPSPVKIAWKGRRTGFTFGEAADDVTISAAQKRAGGMNVYYIGTTLDMAREFIDACASWAVGLQYAAEAIKEAVFDDFDPKTNTTNEIKALRIDFASGFSIWALSSRPRSLRGRQGVVVIDEAAFQDDLEGLVKAAMAMIILGGKVRIISTHDGVENYFNQLILDCDAGRMPYAVHHCTFDEAVDEGLYRTRCEIVGEEWTEEGEQKFRDDVRAFYRPHDAEELDGVPANSGGTYLPMAIILPNVNKDVPVLRWEFKNEFLDLPLPVRNAEVLKRCEEELAPLIAKMDKEAPSYFGGDFGRSANRTTLWPAQKMRDTSLRSPFLLELHNCPFEQHETIFMWVIDRLPRFSKGYQDARGNGQALAEKLRTRYGAERIEEVKATREWYSVHWPPAKARLEDRTAQIIPADRDTQDDLRAVKVVRGVPVIPDQAPGAGNKSLRHGDAAIAYVNLCAAAEADPWMVAYETPSTRPRDVYEPADRRGGVAMRHHDEDELLSAQQDRLTI